MGKIIRMNNNNINNDDNTESDDNNIESDNNKNDSLICMIVWHRHDGLEINIGPRGVI